jgi:hypothetical protein
VTGRKFTRTAAAKRLGITREAVDGLIAGGVLHLESIAGDHEVIPEQEIEEYERTHPRPLWTPWIDPDYRREQADYDDTPTDEGDEQQ